VDGLQTVADADEVARVGGEGKCPEVDRVCRALRDGRSGRERERRDGTGGREKGGRDETMSGLLMCVCLLHGVFTEGVTDGGFRVGL
jgi:hypothetical protein